jgi:hypothetical protein
MEVRIRLQRAIVQGVRLGCLAGLAATFGCSGEKPPQIGQTYEVRGQVLLANGSPLAAGRITLVPNDEKNVQASGSINPDGSFVLTTKTEGDGAGPGDYRVRIDPLPVDPKKPSNKPPFAPRYIDEDSSGLRVTIRPEANRLDPIRLK